jgi:hypothetical protein
MTLKESQELKILQKQVKQVELKQQNKAAAEALLLKIRARLEESECCSVTRVREIKEI